MSWFKNCKIMEVGKDFFFFISGVDNFLSMIIPVAAVMQQLIC